MEIQFSIIIYLNILPAEIITKGQKAKIDIDQVFLRENVILLQIFYSRGAITLHYISPDTEVIFF